MDNCIVDSSMGYGACFPPMRTNWSSNSEFDLGWIKDVSEIAMKSLSKIYGDYSEFNLNQDDLLDFTQLDAKAFVDNSMGPIVYVAVMVVVLLFIVIVSLCWCCQNKCCCCCRSNFKGRSDNEFRSGLTMGGIALSVVMAVWLIALLIMIFHTFPANEKTVDAVNVIPPHLKDSVNDIEGYMNDTVAQLSYLFVGSFTKFQAPIKEIITNLNCPSPGTSCDQELENLKTQAIGSLNSIGENLEVNFNALNDELNSVRSTMKDATARLDTLVDENIGTVVDTLYWFFMLFNILYCVIFGVVLVGTVLSAFSRGNGIKTGGFIMMRCGIVLMFITGALVVLQTVVMFVLSGATSEIVCPAIKRLAIEDEVTTTSAPPTLPGGKGMIVRADADYEPPPFGRILGLCRGNGSAYNAFELEKTFNLTELTKVKLEVPCDSSNPICTIIKQELADKGVDEKVTDYTTFIGDYTRGSLGNCYPVAHVIDKTLSLFCETMTSPIASYWFIAQFIPPTFIVMFITAMFFEKILSS